MSRELRVLFPDNFPMVNKDCLSARETRWCRFPGIASEIIHLIAKHMNISVVEVEHDKTFGVEQVFDRQERDFVGLYQHLRNGSADLIASTMEPLELRKTAWEFTNTLYMSETRIAVRKPDNTLSSVFDFFNVYGPYTWFLMLFTFIAFTIFGLVVRCVERKIGLRSDIKGFSLVWKMIRLQLIQPTTFIYKLQSGNFALVVFSFLQCSIVVSLYQSWILTSVVRQRKAVPFNSENIKSALQENLYFLASAIPNAWYYEMIELTDQDPYFSLGQILKEHKVRPVNTVEDSFALAETEQAIVIVQNDAYDSHIVTRYCLLDTVMSPFPPMNETFMIRKNHPLLKEINEAIEAQKILIHRVFKKYLDFRKPTPCNKNENQHIRAVSLTPYLGVLLLLGVGLSFGAFTFVVEMIFGQEEHEHEM